MLGKEKKEKKLKKKKKEFEIAGVEQSYMNKFEDESRDYEEKRTWTE